MTDRTMAIRNLIPGDVFHAKSPNEASLICLVIEVTETTIQARTATTQLYLEFDRQTGIALWGDDRVPCSIDSVAPLPTEIRQLVFGLDQKFRLETDLEKLKLTEQEVRALLYIRSHFLSNQL